MSKFDLYKTLSNELDINTELRTVSVIPQLNKSDYAKVKSIFERLGGKWSTKNQSFEFTKCPQALIDRVLEVGSQQLNKFHFYPTPQEVFDYMAEFTPLSYLGASVGNVKTLEPSCGEGNLIRCLNEFGEVEGRIFDVDGYDVDPLNVMFCEEAGLNVKQADFLSLLPVSEYDLVIMNPPFNGDEFIKHIRHAQKFLNDNGLLISVIPVEWLKDTGKNSNREWLLEQAQIDSASDLEENNFFEPGTFNGVSLPTAVISLRSVNASKRVLEKDSYKKISIDDFIFFIDNDERSSDRLRVLDKKELSENETILAVEELVRKHLLSSSNDLIHIVKRFEKEYVRTLITERLPHIVVKPRIEIVEQMDLMARM